MARKLQHQPALPLDWGKGRNLLWVDGVNSAVMAKLMLREMPDAEVLHCDLGDSVHPDSRRFIDDLEQWYGKPVIRLRSKRFSTIDDVFEDRQYLSGMHGAPCTGEMKFVPRLDYQLPSDTHFWGYTADKLDAARFDGMLADYPLLKQRSPLIEMGMTKKQTHAFLRDHGIRRPYVYDIGMPNGNCLGCVKSSSPNYWALIRQHFPEVFARRNEQARRFGARPVILRREKGEDGKLRNVRGFLDEIPADQSTKVRGADFGGCGFHCASEA
ncbi:hypothetical protein P7B04_12300 [Sphingobium yanoikuyae]|uniref:hypothetical protein n=1 Tax=Sphingobium yanoikuyae TaxID=13690 RepID=UPI000846898A|nr:hypothetical protein [Sphingobium yanoikuyae]MDG2513478.1 hypothetical protein [Sphingobium yanoikuyae]